MGDDIESTMLSRIDYSQAAQGQQMSNSLHYDIRKVRQRTSMKDCEGDHININRSGASTLRNSFVVVRCNVRVY